MAAPSAPIRPLADAWLPGHCLSWPDLSWPRTPGPGLGLKPLLTALLLGGGLLIALCAVGPVRAEPQPGPQAVPLQCRLAGGPWRPCRMEVRDVGLNWLLRIGDQTIEFRHSGDGAVQMQKVPGAWQPVTASWQPDTSLCWDGVCAKGEIPLD